MLRTSQNVEQNSSMVYVLTSSNKAKSKNEELTIPEKDNPLDVEMQVLETRTNDDHELRFIVIGCQGNGQPSQKRVAALLNEYIKTHPDKRPDFILLTGDNIYESGPDSPFDAGFYNCFEDVYLSFPYLKDIPFFVILGNHDENLHRASLPGSSKGVERGMHEVTYSHLHAKAGTYTTPLHAEHAAKTNIAFLPADTYELDLNNLLPWNMPGRNYSLVKGNTQLFCIDSNTYVKEYLDYLDYLDYQAYLQHVKAGTVPEANNSCLIFINAWKNKGILDTEKLISLLTEKYKKRGIIDDDGKLKASNQAKWLADRTEEANKAHRRKILVLHHPPFTPGKRAYESDITLYLPNEKDRERIKAHFNHLGEISYNTLIQDTLREQQLFYDTILAAHDHDIYYYNNCKKSNNKIAMTASMDNNITRDMESLCDSSYYPTCQFTCGGGGGKSHDRLGFIDQQFMGCFLKHHGFTEVICDNHDPSLIHFSVLTTGKLNAKTYHLKFTNKSCTPIRDYSGMRLQDQQQVEKLCETVKKAIDGYFNFLNEKQEEAHGKYLGFNPFHGNLSHGTTGVKRAHDLWAYISNYKADNYQTTIETIYDIARWDQSMISSLFTSPKEHSFITYLEKEITNAYGNGQSLTSLYMDSCHGSLRKSIDM